MGQRNAFIKLSDTVLNQVEPRFRSTAGQWVGVSSRARVLVYNTQKLREAELPDSILGLTDAKWRGRIGWAPTNGSFQAFVTALRGTEGEAEARRWLQGIKANDPKSYANNTAIVRAVAAGEIDLGLVNHYYLYAIQKDQGPIPVRNYHPRDGRAGAMINVAGAGILASSKNQESAGSSSSTCLLRKPKTTSPRKPSSTHSPLAHRRPPERRPSRRFVRRASISEASPTSTLRCGFSGRPACSRLVMLVAAAVIEADESCGRKRADLHRSFMKTKRSVSLISHL